MYYGQSALVGVAAQITASAVTNFTTSDIICLLFDENFDPLVQVTNTLQSISINGTGIDIYGVGCGTPGGLSDRGAGQQLAHALNSRYEGCLNCSPSACLGRIWNCLMSFAIMCPLSPSVC